MFKYLISIVRGTDKISVDIWRARLRDHSYVLEEDFHTLLAIHQLKLDL